MSTSPPAPPTRAALRERLLAARERFVSSPEVALAQASMAQALRQVIDQLEPACLGLYWAMRSEFNAAGLWCDDKVGTSFRLALPFARRQARQMHYRLWDGQPPRLHDECGIATSDAAEVVPDVVLVPCVGFTPDGYRLGYGGGYFDRWLAAHPHVTAVGVAWSVGALGAGDFTPEPHDQPLALVVTERGVLG
ncbi:MAG: 5-formyltetrahydrofolate cyclo-ligase [Rhizobacter sp.]|nr:5-formyltetrahydrofolate cyclo-ligase [Rhizobacter sp.]